MKLMIFRISQQSMVTQQVNGDGFIYSTMEKMKSNWDDKTVYRRVRKLNFS